MKRCTLQQLCSSRGSLEQWRPCGKLTDFLSEGRWTLTYCRRTIDDRDAPKIANTFHDHLFKNCNTNSETPVFPDLKAAAEALHLAVAKLRKEPGISFKRWVPFVHYGL
jgi:hypothetical protein